MKSLETLVRHIADLEVRLEELERFKAEWEAKREACWKELRRIRPACGEELADK